MEKIIGTFFIFIVVAVLYAVIKLPDHTMNIGAFGSGTKPSDLDRQKPK